MQLSSLLEPGEHKTTSSRRFPRRQRSARCVLLALCSLTLILLIATAFRTSNITHQDVIQTVRTIHKTLSETIIEPKTFQPTSTKITRKWIVVTSVSNPTEDVKRLASFDEWTLVVVGDTNTPANWSFPQVHFLSTQMQESLGFEILSYLPYKSYTRKNVGYLYAIKMGAEYIYDTDDDNKPYGNGLSQFDYTESVSGLRYHAAGGNISQQLFNPYRFFGNADMWPRGFPLEHIQGHTNGEDRMRLCRRHKTPAVQQGLVHKDPDVDAVYRLLHADRQTGLSHRFSQFAPPVTLAPGTYSPWNSQNTLFHRRAFYTLWLPSTVAFRVTDIWRSYFAQKLLHLTGESVAFYPVNAVQIRNAHDYLADFDDENEVYLKSGEIVKFLDEWKCEMKMSECVIELAEEFRKREFWKEEDVALAKAWIADLTAIRYTFPTVHQHTAGQQHYSIDEKNSSDSDVRNCRRANAEFLVDVGVKRGEPNEKRAREKISHMGELWDWCAATEGLGNSSFGLPHAPTLAAAHASQPLLERLHDKVLIVTNNFAWSGTIGIIQRMYEPYFGTVFYCGTYEPDTIDYTSFPDRLNTSFNFIHLTKAEMNAGYRAYYCMTKASEMRLQNVRGYYMMSDDLVFNLWNSMGDSQFVHGCGIHAADEKHLGAWWGRDVGRAAIHRSVDILHTKYRDDADMKEAMRIYEHGVASQASKYPDTYPGTQNYEKNLKTVDGWAVSDFVYVPSEQLNQFANLMQLFFEGKVFHEIAVSKYLHSVPFETANHLFLWYDGKRGHWEDYYNTTLSIIHPIKFNSFKDPPARKNFCTTVLKGFYDNLLAKHIARG